MKTLPERARWDYFLKFVFSGLTTVLLLGFLLFSPGKHGNPSLLEIMGWQSKNIVALILLLLGAWIIISYLVAEISRSFVSYELSEQGFIQNFGILNKRSVLIPYQKMQDVDLNQNILERLLNLATIRIGTATSLPSRSMLEGTLRGVDYDDAVEMRTMIVEKIRLAHNPHG